jgi:hypothetical protein
MGGGGFLGLGPAPKAPPPPDYAGAARETATGNLDAARAAAAANRVNQVTPYGNLNYAVTGTDPYGNPTWTATTSLSDVGQQLLNNQNAASLGLGSAITSQLGQVQDVMGRGFNPNTPAIQYGGQGPQLGQVGQGPQFARAGTAAQAQGVGQAQQAQGMGNAPNLQTGLDFQGMEGWDKATALLNQRLQPQIQQSEDRLRAQLANQGVVAGTEAYNRAMRQQGQKTNDLLTQAQLAGQNVQQNMFGQALQGGQFANQAMLGQNQAQLGNVALSNQAAQQNYANQIAGTQLGNQAAQQNYANQLAGLGFNNQAGQQGFANQLAAQQQQNQALQQMFANQQAGASLSNQAQQQAYNQALTQYNMPLNTLSALRTGAQVQNPSFVNAPQQATTSGADILGATQMGYNAQMGDFNAQNAAQQNFNSGLMGLGGAGIMAFSDIRMKENIKQIHWLPNGLPVYEFEYKPEFKDQAGHGKFVGVMAQEVEMVQPEAVITNADGYKMVNYGVLNG